MRFAKFGECDNRCQKMEKVPVCVIPACLRWFAFLICTGIVSQVHSGKLSDQRYISTSNHPNNREEMRDIFDQISHQEPFWIKLPSQPENAEQPDIFPPLTGSHHIEKTTTFQYPAPKQDKNSKELATDNASQGEQEVADFSEEYWIRVAQAKALAIVVEHGVIPRVDEYSEIIKPAGCKSEYDKRCTDITTTCAEKKANEIFEKIKSGRQPAKRGNISSNVDTILNECNFSVLHRSWSHDNRAKIVPPPATTPAPQPLFHCNSYLGQNNVDINFRMDYTKPGLLNGKSSMDVPRYFVIEIRRGGKWVLAPNPVQAYWLFKFNTETNTQFQVRVTAVSPRYVYLAVTSAVVPVFPSSLLELKRSPVLEKKNVFIDDTASRPAPSAYLKWRSNSGFNASCDWNVYYIYDRQITKERKTSEKAFWVLLNNLDFERTYHVSICEKFGNGLELQTSDFVRVPSCAQIRKENASLCLAPTPPRNLRMENVTGHSFFIAWDPPIESNGSLGEKLKYNVTLEWRRLQGISAAEAKTVLGMASTMGTTLASTHSSTSDTWTHVLLSDIVPGNLTRIQMHNMSVWRGHIKMSVMAMGPAGKSQTAWRTFRYEGDLVKAELRPSSTSNITFWILAILAPFIVVTLMLFIGVSKHKQGKHRRKNKTEGNITPKPEPPMELQPLKEPLHAEWEIDWCSLTLEEKLGEGFFGVVSRGIITQNGHTMTVAVKQCKVSVDKREVDKIWEEYEILRNLDPHLHVVGLKGIVTKYVPQPLLVVEYCDGGSLLDFLRRVFKAWGCGASRRYSPAVSMLSCSGSSVHSQGNSSEHSNSRVAVNTAYFLPIEEELTSEADSPPPSTPPPMNVAESLNYSRQVSVGMEYLSNNKIVHRDLAARNVLISGRSHILKIADFGLSRDVYETELYERTTGGRLPVKWMAKESLLHHISTTKSDVWSFGILLYEIFTFGGVPYPEAENAEMSRLLNNNYRMPRPYFCPEQVYRLMRSCWQNDPDARPNFTDCRNMLENIIQEITHVTYLNLEPNPTSGKDARFQNCDSGFGNYEGSGSSEGECPPELPPRNKMANE